MIDAIVYSSLSGSCEEYAHRMSAALHVPFFTEQSHICPTGRKVVYIGWLLAGKVVGLDKAKERYNVVGVVSVGMGAPAANAEEVCRKKNGLGADVAVFPLQGRFDLKRLPLPYRLNMKVKIKDIAKRLNAKAAKTTLTPAEQACLTMATVGRGEPEGRTARQDDRVGLAHRVVRLQQIGLPGAGAAAAHVHRRDRTLGAGDDGDAGVRGGCVPDGNSGEAGRICGRPRRQAAPERRGCDGGPGHSRISSCTSDSWL